MPSSSPRMRGVPVIGLEMEMTLFVRLHPITRLAAAIAMLATLGAPALAADVTNVSITDDPQIGYTRVTIESDELLTYRMFTLAEQQLRLVIDTQKVDWKIPGEEATGGQRRASGAGLVSQYRFAQNAEDTSRMVLDLAAPVQVTQQFLLRPNRDTKNFRLILDLQPTGYADFAENSGFIAPVAPPPPAATAAARVDPAPVVTASDAPRAKRVIVVDAGHGGHDPGAIGATQKHEKNFNLNAALALRDILQATGRYEVVLTRSTDVYVDHDDRVQIAREADLFISLHSDAAENRSASGASVYTLSDRGLRRARDKVLNNNWLANETLTSRAQDVNGILVDLAQRDTKNQSSAFAEMVIENLGDGGVGLLRNTHREANLYVLLAPDVPAVLLEMGFVSNPADEANLGSSTYRASMMQAVSNAIDEYFEGRERRFAGR